MSDAPFSEVHILSQLEKDLKYKDFYHLEDTVNFFQQFYSNQHYRSILLAQYFKSETSGKEKWGQGTPS